MQKVKYNKNTVNVKIKRVIQLSNTIKYTE